MFTLAGLASAARPDRISGARPSMAVRVSTQIVLTWRCQDQLGVDRTPARSPWALARHSSGYRIWLLNRWMLRRTACLQALAEVKRQWGWQAWLPDKWRRVGICETGLNWHHANSSYVSAFGISRQAYDEDAAVMGAPPWNDRVHPSPWNQYQAALGHYKLHSGFSGWGCRGA